MPRKNRRDPAERSSTLGRPKGLVPSRSGYQVRESTATKVYRCPGCNQEIRIGTIHVVAWREDDAEDRRHWHTPCFRGEDAKR